MTQAEAIRFIERGKAALERRDVNAIMNVMSPQARILGMNTDDMRQIITGAVGQVHGHLTPVTKNVAARQTANTAEISFDMDLNQKTPEMDAVYFMNYHFTVRLEKAWSSHLLGLYRTEDWLITSLESNPHIEAPVL
jgi:hypothetical protein